MTSGNLSLHLFQLTSGARAQRLAWPAWERPQSLLERRQRPSAWSGEGARAAVASRGAEGEEGLSCAPTQP